VSENSNIEWCDHTFNPWTGCEAISPGCDHCYADAWARRAGREFHVRKRTTESYWRQPLKWQRNATAFFDLHGRRQRVFCASLADVFDNAVPSEWRRSLLELIASTPNLDWLLLTKRIGNAHRLLDEALDVLSHGLTRWADAPWPNVWIGATIVNQAEADRDIPKLLALPARVRFLSCEPLLGALNLSRWLVPSVGGSDANNLRTIDWVIAGGESGHDARPMHPDWPRALRNQCLVPSVPFLFKQWGEHMPADDDECDPGVPPSRLVWSDGSTWIESDGQRGGVHLMARVGKKAAGRILDGREWSEFPREVLL
jgi:protein gp37